MTNSKRRLGHVGGSDLFFLDGGGQGVIILMEALVTKITFEVPFKELGFQKTQIGLVCLTKRSCRTPSYGAACARPKAGRVYSGNHRSLESARAAESWTKVVLLAQ